VNSGFGSQPCFVLDEDDGDENDEGGLDDDNSMSGIEPLDTLHHDDYVLDNISNRDLSGCSLTVAGKSYSGELLCTSMYSVHRRVCIFYVIFGRRRMMNVFWCSSVFFACMCFINTELQPVVKVCSVWIVKN